MKAEVNNINSTKESFYLQVSLLVLLGLSLLGNVFLGWRVKRLFLQNESLQMASSSVPSVGMKIEKLSVTDISGRKTSLFFKENQPTILYIFRPHCKWCGLNLASIRSLSRQRASQIRFIGISSTADDLKSYLHESPLPFPVYVADGTEELTKLHFVGTPQTVEISNSGTVEQNWLGAYKNNIASSIEKQLSVKLPSLSVQ